MLSSASSAGRCSWFWRHHTLPIHHYKTPLCSLFNRNAQYSSQCVNNEWNLHCCFFYLTFIHSESASAAGSFSNRTRLAPLSTMIRPICRSLSQMGKIAENNLLARTSMVSRAIPLNIASVFNFCMHNVSPVTASSLCILLF